MDRPSTPPADLASPESGRRRPEVALRSFASYGAMIFVLLTLGFALPRAMPGDPVEALVAQSPGTFLFGEESRNALERYYGLDRPLVDQYRHYLSRLAHGDLGRSLATNAPVRDELARRLPWTLLLVGTATAIAATIGILLGIQAGWRRGRPLDGALLTTLLALQEFPPFLLASMMVFVFSVQLDWLPLFGARTPFGDPATFAAAVVDVGRHLVLPVSVLVIGLTAGTYLVMRAGMVTELGADHVLLARAKGMPERRIKYHHVARNALLPVTSLTALQLGFAVTGAVFVERVFAYPGLGELIFSSIGSRDYPTLQGAFLLTSVSVVTINAAAGAWHRRLDPRTR